MPIALHRVRSSMRRASALEEAGGDKDGLVSIYVPVPRKEIARILDQEVEVESWDYEVQTVRRARHPDEERAIAIKEGRFKPELIERSLQAKGFAADKTTRCGKHIEYDLENIPSIDEETGDATYNPHPGCTFTVRGDINSERQKVRGRHSAAFLPDDKLNIGKRRHSRN